MLENDMIDIRFKENLYQVIVRLIIKALNSYQKLNLLKGCLLKIIMKETE